MLPASRPFVLPEWFAWTANIMGVAYVILTTVLFVFPPELPVTGSSMNYCIVAFAIVFIISAITWIFDGRKNYTGPQVEIDAHVLTAVQSPENSRGSEMEEAYSSKVDGKGSEDKTVV